MAEHQVYKREALHIIGILVDYHIELQRTNIQLVGEAKYVGVILTAESQKEILKNTNVGKTYTKQNMGSKSKNDIVDIHGGEPMVTLR